MTARTAATFSQLTFCYPFRKYQRLILAQIESGQGDKKYHIVAPPGSGKTIVGLELVRRFAEPAVVFTPTTTIQQQWREKVALFTPDTAAATEITSCDPERLAPINIFTYQLISTPGEAQEHEQQAAMQRWVEDLLGHGQATDEQGARQRIETMRQNNRRAYDRELRRRYNRIRRELLGQGGRDAASLLHPNARGLIERLVEYGVRTVVLDECHHLLDYWALVLQSLIHRIDDVRVVGLTATLPSPEDDQQYENYTSLLGEVDFEVPTPAVVKEGDLAPYRDLVYFVTPSEREYSYLHHIQHAFEDAIATLTQSPRFGQWLDRLVLERPGRDGQIPWQDFLHDQPILSLAALRFLLRGGRSLPPELALPREAEAELTLEDWLALLERYALDELKMSADRQDHERLAALRRAILPFGLTLTERGLRQGRSPGDLVLTLSEAKDRAVAHILDTESRALQERLRAVVVTDFARMSSGARRRLDGVLEHDAGSAERVFRRLVADPRTGHLDPILVTGKTVLVDADLGAELLAHFSDYLQAQGLRAACSYRSTEYEGILAVEGAGPDWSPRAYVRMVTDAFEQGYTRCLVGTRGIFGEGWDSLSLNTLIDLTSVTTSTSVQQLRGRTIRKDPDWPRKVAHHWDVICVAPEFKRGDADLQRFVQRHRRYWGIVPVSKTAELLSDAAGLLAGQELGPQLSAAVVKGVSHVDPDLAFDLAVKPFKRISYGRYTRRMLRQVRQRERTYGLWGIGDEYSNFSYTTTRLQADDLRFHTVFTLRETLKSMLRRFRAGFAATALFIMYAGMYTLLPGIAGGAGSGLALLPAIGLLLFLAMVIALAGNARSAYRIGRKLLVQQPPDAILLDVGTALLEALRAAGMVSRHLQNEYVRVVVRPDSSYQVLLDYASPEDAATFVRAYQQIFRPVRDQRYLILRDDTRLPGLGMAALWAVLRRCLRQQGAYEPAYHPVPDVLAVRRELADSFAQAWQRYVGGGELIFTRNERGRQLLLRARAQRRPEVESLAFEVWR